MFIELRVKKSISGVYTKILVNTNEILSVSNRSGYSEPMVNVEIKMYPDKTYHHSGAYAVASEQVSAYHSYEDIMYKLTGIRYTTELTGPFG